MHPREKLSLRRSSRLLLTSLLLGMCALAPVASGRSDPDLFDGSAMSRAATAPLQTPDRPGLPKNQPADKDASQDKLPKGPGGDGPQSSTSGFPQSGAQGNPSGPAGQQQAPGGTQASNTPGKDATGGQAGAQGAGQSSAGNSGQQGPSGTPGSQSGQSGQGSGAPGGASGQGQAGQQRPDRPDLPKGQSPGKDAAGDKADAQGTGQQPSGPGAQGGASGQAGGSPGSQSGQAPAGGSPEQSGQGGQGKPSRDLGIGDPSHKPMGDLPKDVVGGAPKDPSTPTQPGGGTPGDKAGSARDKGTQGQPSKPMGGGTGGTSKGSETGKDMPSGI